MTHDIILAIIIGALVAFELTMFIDLLFAMTDPNRKDKK